MKIIKSTNATVKLPADPFMLHVAMLASDDDGNSADWGALVTFEQYEAAR